MNCDKGLAAAEPMREESGSQVVWTNSIMAADRALEEAVTIQRGVERSLKLQQEVDALRDELKLAKNELRCHKDMHARAASSLRQLESHHALETARLRAEIDSWQVRHRVYKALAEHYGLMLLRFSAEKLAEHRDRVFHHIRFHKRRGRHLTEIGTAEIAPILQ